MNKKDYDLETKTNLKLFLILNRCNLSVNKNIYPIFKKEGITEAQFNVLELLYHKGSFKIKEIIEKTFSSGGTMTVIIENLNKMGLIIKEKDENDKRSYKISITDNGINLVEKIFDKHIDNLSQILGVLNKKEKNELINLLKTLGKAQ